MVLSVPTFPRPPVSNPKLTIYIFSICSVEMQSILALENKHKRGRDGTFFKRSVEKLLNLVYFLFSFQPKKDSLESRFPIKGFISLTSECNNLLFGVPP